MAAVKKGKKNVQKKSSRSKKSSLKKKDDSELHIPPLTASQRTSKKNVNKEQKIPSSLLLKIFIGFILLGVVLLTLFFARDAPRTVETGDTVSVWYVGSFTNGEIFDTNIPEIVAESGVGNPDGRPLTFRVGARQMIPGFDAAVVGMREGQTKTVTIPPDQAYGNYQADLVMTYDDNEFLQTFGIENPVRGGEFGFTLTDGRQGVFVIQEVGNGFVTVDFN